MKRTTSETLVPRWTTFDPLSCLGLAFVPWQADLTLLSTDVEIGTEPHALDAAWLRGRTVAFVGRLGGTNRRRARQIVRDAGGVAVEQEGESCDLIVLGADQSLAGELTAVLGDQVVERAGAGQVEIISETEWWHRLGVVDDDAATRRLYTPAMLAELLKVPLAVVRRWHRVGLIRPVRQIHRLPYFDFAEVASARQLARLLTAGNSPAQIEARFARLAERFPDLARPLSQLPLIVEGRHLLLRKGSGLVEPDGQMRLEFEAVDSAAIAGDGPMPQTGGDVLGFPQSTAGPADAGEPRAAEDFIALANDLEDEGRLQEAAEVCRTMLLALGATAEGAFRLAELLYSQGQLAAARERYSMAVELSPDYVEARASLGCVLLELHEPELALAAFRGALDIHPDYPDVHYHLARLLDDRGQAGEAEPHWQAFLRLAPHSPWSGEARQRLGLTVFAEEGE